MNRSPAPPFDAWLSMQAWNETWLAGLDPEGVGRRLRERRLARLIERAMGGSPLYRRRNPGARRLADFEPVGRTELMAGFDDWATDRRITRAGAQAFVDDPSRIADGWLGGQYLLWTSSGTSGEPGLFVQDAASLAAFDAIDAQRLRRSAALPWTLAGWGAGQRFAYVAATGGHFAGQVSIERLRRLMSPLPLAPVIDSFSVLEPLASIAAALNACKPGVLISYPSCAAALALRQLDGGLGLALQEVWVGGEQLSPQQRQLIHAAFGCPLHNNYGASEFYSMASECRHGRMHLNDDWLILEPVDAQLRPVPEGTLSDSVLLTNLANCSQPLLRYRLDDRIRFTGERCPCGGAHPVIQLEGRADDTLALHDGQGRPVTILPLALETAIEEGAGVTHFQLLCDAQGCIEVRFEPGVADTAAAFKATRRVLGEFLGRHGVRPLRIEHGRAAPLRGARSGKLSRVVRRAGGSVLRQEDDQQPQPADEKNHKHRQRQ